MTPHRRLPIALAAALALIAGAARLATAGAEGWPLLILGAVLVGAWIVEQTHHHDDDREDR